MSTDIFSYKAIKPFQSLGLTGNFWTLHIDTLIATWTAMICLGLIIIFARYYFKQKPSTVSLGIEQIVGFFITLCKDSFTYFNYNYFAFITSIFFFTFFCCLVGVLPYVEEATRDLNTTLALGLASFLYIQYQKIKVHGIWGYFKEFAEPVFLLAPIHVVGELSKIASMSFRLFGNILGGGVILIMIIDLLHQYQIFFLGLIAIIILMSLASHIRPLRIKIPALKPAAHMLLNVVLLISWMRIFLGIFEGLIQSFVITTLTATYLAIGTQPAPDHQTGEHA